MTLVQKLLENAQYQPDQLIYRFLNNKSEVSASYTHRELWQASSLIADYLIRQGVSVGDRALLLFQSNDVFIPAILGCFMAGVIAVPATVPSSDYTFRKIERIVSDCMPSIVLSDAATIQKFSRLTASQWQDSRLLEKTVLANFGFCDIAALMSEAKWPAEITVKHRHHDIAFLQYTSGSTGDPKGVMISHDNLISNLSCIASAYGFTEALKGQLRGVSWLPSSHDMGLVGMIFETIYVCGEMTLLPPLSFMFNPLRWLQAISKYKATISAAPNFAYDLCATKIKAADLTGLSLDTWQVAICGAETVSAAVAKRFIEKYAPYGFSEKAFYPSYGMAEATLCVSAKQGLSIAQQGDSDFVSCGKPALALSIMQGNRECESGEVGEIWIHGSSVTQGYWQKPEINAALFSANHYLKTGDLGFIEDGELFVTGRIKELIIINGVNYVPQDIEDTVKACDALFEQQSVVAFSVNDSNTEKLVVMAEIKRHAKDVNIQTLASILRTTVLKRHRLTVHDVIFLPKSRIPRTTSGKLKRAVCRQAYINNTLNTLFKHDFVLVETTRAVA